jgi:DNA polymerase elongation subunit (family B)
MKYYTNIAINGNNILFRGVNNGRRVKMKVQYSPTFFLPSKKQQSGFQSLFGEQLEPMKFETIRDARDFMKRYDEVSNFKIYGQERFEYAFIADEYKGLIDWDINDIYVAILDIEVGSENGFPDPYRATEPITAISIQKLNGGIRVYGCGDFNNTRGDVTYIKCRDEYDLCKKFLADWSADCPDVYTGWNTEFFDIPYIVNRFNKILGEEETKKLSPWSTIRERVVKGKHGQELKTYNLIGISGLDYIELYKWYAPNGKSQESYKLDHIASEELGESKLSYDEYDNLFKLISTKSKDITVPVNKPKEKLEEFEKWIRLKNMLKNSLDNE